MGLKLIKVSELDFTKHDTVTPEYAFAEFCEGVRTAARGYNYCYTAPYEAWVYREGDTFCMGYLSRKDMTDAGTADVTFNVFSPNIQNGKYSYGSREHMASSVNVAKAIKNATKYLRPLSMKQVVVMTQGAVKDKARDIVNDAENKVKTATSDLRDGLFSTYGRSMGTNRLQRELEHLCNSGYEFIDVELGENLRTAFANLSELNQSRETNSHVYTIVDAFKNPAGDWRYRVAENVELQWYTPEINPEQIKMYTQEDIPEDIQRKVSVLSMVQDDQYVEGVGYRAAPTLYYIK
jgi:hypothetical protein